MAEPTFPIAATKETEAMKKYPKILQSDKRGQIVIPKEIRSELKITEGTGFYAYTITNEGIFLKLIPTKELGEHKEAVEKLKQKAAKLKIKKENIEKSVKKYKKTKDEKGMEII